MAKRNVLLVDPDPRHLRVMEVALRNAGFAVTPLTDGAEAWARVSSEGFDLVIADTALPSLDGYELCRRLRAEPRLEATPLVLVSGDDGVEHKVRGLELGADDYLTRPIYTRELVARVRALMQKRERARAEASGRRRFYGSLGDMSVVDLIQTMARGRKSGTVHVERPGAHATLWFRDGALIDASTGRLQGVDAVYRALTWEAGEFDIEFRAPARPTAITTPTQDVLMEGLGRLDAWSRLVEQLPPLTTIYEVDYDELAERLGELPDEANALLRLFDGRRSAIEAIDDAPLGDLDALGVMSQLWFEGMIRRVDGPVAPSAPSEPAGVFTREPLGLGHEPAMSATPAMTRAAAPSLADALFESVAAPRVETPAPARRTPPAESPSWGAIGSDAPPTKVVQPPPPLQPPRREDFPALPVSDAVADAEHEDAFFDASPALAAPDDAFDFGEAPAGAPLPRLAWVAIGLFGVAVLTAVGWLTLRDTVDPRPVPEGALEGGWHREALQKQPAIAAVKAIEAEWRIPSEPGGGPTPAIPAFAASAAAEPAPDDAPEAPEAPPAAPEAPTAAAPTPAPTPSPAAPREAPAAPAAPAGDESPADARALIAEGQALHKSRKYKQAIDRYERALALAPNNKAALLSYAKALIEVNRGRDALDAATRAERLDKSDPEVYLLLGNARQDADQTDPAIKAYERFLQLAPGHQYAAEVRQVVEGLKSSR